MAEIIKLMNIDKVYGEKVKTQVLFDINLSFRESSFNSLIGSSGSGKSTMLNIIGTLDKPTSGQVIIDGKNIGELNKKQLSELRNQTIGFIFQFHYLLPEFTVKENILMPQRISRKNISEDTRKWADQLIEMTGLTAVANNLSIDISGGQQQRTAIARALMNKPKIVLADEPTGNLDSDTSEKIYTILRDIKEKYKTTFIIITHDQRIAEKTDRIIEIKDGKINLDLAK